MATLIGSATMELEKAFRLMSLELLMKLSIEECYRIAYVACIDKTIPPEHGNDFRLYLFTTLESRRQICPLKLQFLEEILKKLGRNDLLDLISKYKKSSIYRKAQKKKRKKKVPQCQRKDSATPSSTIHQYEETFALFLTQFSQMSLSMRDALETHDLPIIKQAFSSVANNSDAVTYTFRKLSIAGVNSDTSSSGESSATPPPERMELPNAQLHCPNDTIPDVYETSAHQIEFETPRVESTKETELIQPPHQASQAHIPNIPEFVYCNSPISQRQSTSKLIGASDPEDMDNTGEGTGDSGLGDMANHTLSREALAQIAPGPVKPRPDPLLEDSEDDTDDHPKGRAQQAGYTPLIIRKLEPDHSNNDYAKPTNIHPKRKND